MKNTRTLIVSALAALLLASPAQAAIEPPQSPTLVRAKDFIADEQWERAIEQLRKAVDDARERHKDEALFWLAHSLHQSRDYAAGLQSILTLERQHPKSPWVKPAQSLRLEIAQKLRRSDVLWFTVGRQAATTTVQATSPAAPSPRKGSAPAVESSQATTPAAERPPRRVDGPRTTQRTLEGVTIVPTPSAIWIPDGWSPDTNQRIQALGSLMQTDAPKVIPILREIALESPDPNEASRAVFVLAQSGKPEAYTIVLEVARRGTESVQIAAVRELGRFGGPKMAEELLKVYSSSNPRVKYQVVHSLGERLATTALMQIAERESDRRLQETAIVRLGQAGGRQQLRQFYTRAATTLKRPIIVGLFNARAEDELIAIAERERDDVLRREVLTRLRLLGTVKARAYIEKEARNR
jgi:hypothetical protein